MLAVTGILVQSFVRFPGFPPFPVSNPARPLAVLKGLLESGGNNNVVLFLLAVGVVELTIGKQVCDFIRAVLLADSAAKVQSAAVRYYGGTHSAFFATPVLSVLCSDLSSLVASLVAITHLACIVPLICLWVRTFISHTTAVDRQTGHSLDVSSGFPTLWAFSDQIQPTIAAMRCLSWPLQPPLQPPS